MDAGLTFAGPHGPDDVMLDAEDDGGHDDGRQCRLGDEGAVGHEEGEAEDDQEAGVEAAEGRLDPAGAVHGRPGEAAGGGHGLDEGAEDVAETQGDHLLTGVH